MNMNINQSENQGVTVTPPAKEKIAELLSGADQSQSAVRVFVSGGGCGGMNYGMTFAESVEETDRLIQDNSGCSIAIDPVALAYLEGAEIDFRMMALARHSYSIMSSRRWAAVAPAVDAVVHIDIPTLNERPSR